VNIARWREEGKAGLGVHCSVIVELSSGEGLASCFLSFRRPVLVKLLLSVGMVVLDMLSSSSNQYLQPDYMSPFPMTVSIFQFQ